MPQITVKNLKKEILEQIAPKMTNAVAEIINVPRQHIVIEHNDVTFFRAGREDKESVMVWICWKERPKELQEKVAKECNNILKSVGCNSVEVIYDNLDMGDFYEFK